MSEALETKDISEEIFVNTARKFRPMRFEDVVGQEHITTTLRNSFELNRLHHAYLFCGPRGVGKTTTARILAKTVNCLNLVDFEPCNQCVNCISVLEGKSMDIIEIDGASNNSVDDARKLKDMAIYSPGNGKYKMFIIDEVHMLTTAAFNALLKILEEPPPHLIFVFATTEIHKVPSTIISRCQRFDFKRMAIASIVQQLSKISKKQNVEIDEESLHLIARKADGSMRDSQSIFDQAVAFCGKNIRYTSLAEALSLIDEEFYFKVTDAISTKNIRDIYFVTQDIIRRGYDLQECINGIIEHFRNLLVVKITNNTDAIDASQSILDRYKTDSKLFSVADLQRFSNYLIAVDKEIKFSSQPKIRFEIALCQLATMDRSYEIATLINELKKIKRTIPDDTSAAQNTVLNNDSMIGGESTFNKNYQGDAEKLVTQLADEKKNDYSYVAPPKVEQAPEPQPKPLSEVIQASNPVVAEPAAKMEVSSQANVAMTKEEIQAENPQFNEVPSSNQSASKLHPLEQYVVENFNAKLY